MDKKQAKAILEGKKVEMIAHNCPDGVVYKWIPRKEEPTTCPRCKTRRDIERKRR